MKENDWQLLRFIFLRLVFLLWVVFPFMEFSVIEEYNVKKLATNFSPVFLLHCYTQVASFFTFISHYSVKLLFLKWLPYIDTRKLDVRIVVPKLQSLILRVTRRDVLLVHCIAPNDQISPQNPKMVRITILLGSTAPQNLMSLSSVHFVIKSFQDFTLHLNIETLNTECKSDQEQEMWMWNT